MRNLVIALLFNLFAFCTIAPVPQSAFLTWGKNTFGPHISAAAHALKTDATAIGKTATDFVVKNAPVVKNSVVAGTKKTIKGITRLIDKYPLHIAGLAITVSIIIAAVVEQATDKDKVYLESLFYTIKNYNYCKQPLCFSLTSDFAKKYPTIEEALDKVRAFEINNSSFDEEYYLLTQKLLKTIHNELEKHPKSKLPDLIALGGLTGAGLIIARQAFPHILPKTGNFYRDIISPTICIKDII